MTGNNPLTGAIDVMGAPAATAPRPPGGGGRRSRLLAILRTVFGRRGSIARGWRIAAWRSARAQPASAAPAAFAGAGARLGLADLGGLLSCNRDAAMIDGFNPGIAFRRTRTIMAGATHCDFRYRQPGLGGATGRG